MNMSRQLNEMESDRDRTKSRILQLQKLLADCEEGMFSFLPILYPFLRITFYTSLWMPPFFILLMRLFAGLLWQSSQLLWRASASHIR